MTYYERLPKEKLREFQRKSTLSQKLRYRKNYINAYKMYNDHRNIYRIADGFNVSVRTAYRMVERGKREVQNMSS